MASMTIRCLEPCQPLPVGLGYLVVNHPGVLVAGEPSTLARSDHWGPADKSKSASHRGIAMGGHTPTARQSVRRRHAVLRDSNVVISMAIVAHWPAAAGKRSSQSHPQVTSVNKKPCLATPNHQPNAIQISLKLSLLTHFI